MCGLQVAIAPSLLRYVFLALEVMCACHEAEPSMTRDLLLYIRSSTMQSVSYDAYSSIQLRMWSLLYLVQV